MSGAHSKKSNKYEILLNIKYRIKKKALKFNSAISLLPQLKCRHKSLVTRT
jgi:hypothetical protein